MLERKTVYISVGQEDTWVRIGNQTWCYSGIFNQLRLLVDLIKMRWKDRAMRDWVIVYTT